MLNSSTSRTFVTLCKETIKKPFVNFLFSLPDPARKFFFRPRVRSVVSHIPVVRALYIGWFAKHPIDAELGTDTSGFVASDALQDDGTLTAQLMPYMGCQPSLVRRALQALPPPAGRTFIDLGCGKGRALIIASEFAFDQVVGVEISSELAAIARANAKQVHRRFPTRTYIEIEQANAVTYALSAGRLVIFLYNPFGPELFERLLENLEQGLASVVEHAFIIYLNPVHGDYFDRAPFLSRWFAQAVDYDDSEIAFGPDIEETVVIWQSRCNALPAVQAERDRPIVVRMAGWSAKLQ